MRFLDGSGRNEELLATEIAIQGGSKIAGVFAPKSPRGGQKNALFRP